MRKIVGLVFLVSSSALAADPSVTVRMSSSAAADLAAITEYEKAPPDAWLTRSVESSIKRRAEKIRLDIAEWARVRYLGPLTLPQLVEAYRGNFIPTPYPSATPEPTATAPLPTATATRTPPGNSERP